jgi:hypothetical protein
MLSGIRKQETYQSPEVSNKVADEFLSLIPLYNRNLAEFGFASTISDVAVIPGWVSGTPISGFTLNKTLNETYGIQLDKYQVLYLVNANFSYVINQEIEGFFIYYEVTRTDVFVYGAEGKYFNETIAENIGVSVIKF